MDRPCPYAVGPIPKPPLPDYWPEILDAIPDVLHEAHDALRDPELIEVMERRYREGARLYKGDWLTKPPEWFDKEAAEEGADLVIYLAMKRVLGKVRRITTNGLPD